MQDFQKLVSGATLFGQLYGILNNSMDALRSQFAGTSFPENPTAGQPCYRTDVAPPRLYLYSGTAWIEAATASAAFAALLAEMTSARGDAASLAARLNVALNADGTLRGDAPASDWWTAEPDAATLARVSDTDFSVAGDKRALYAARRALLLAFDGADPVATWAASTAYDAEANRTQVTISRGTVAADPVGVEFGQPAGNEPSIIFATQAEALAGTNDDAAMTPLKTWAAFNTGIGARIATPADLTAGTPGRIVDSSQYKTLNDNVQLRCLRRAGSTTVAQINAHPAVLPPGKYDVWEAAGLGLPGVSYQILHYPLENSPTFIVQIAYDFYSPDVYRRVSIGTWSAWVKQYNTPTPTAASGLGQFLYVHNGTLILPAGGTWAYFLIGSDKGLVSGGYAGIAAGGTNIGLGFTWHQGFAWRIV